MSNLRTVRRLLSYTKRNVSMIIIAAISSVLYSLSALLFPVLVGEAVGYMFGKGSVDMDKVVNLIYYMIGLLVILGGFGWLTGYAANTLAYRTTGRLRKNVFSKINRLPISVIDSTPNGEFIARGTSDIEFISDGLVQTFTEVISGVTTIVGTIVIMMIINWVMGLVVVVLTPLSLFVAMIITKKCKNSFSEKSKRFGQMAGYTEEIIGGLGVIGNFDVKDRVREQFGAISSKLHKVGVKAHFHSAMINPSIRIVNNIVYAVVAVAGALLAVTKFEVAGASIVEAGILTTFLLFASQYTKPFNTLSNVVAELQMAISSANRVFELIDKESEPDESEKDKELNASGDVKFNHVAFGYTPDRQLFTDMNVEVRHGQKVAIVGKTGSGKTTLINLIMRFYEVNSGNITIAGKDIRDIDRRALRSHIGMVLQDTWLFSGTIRDNIAYGKPNATDEEIEAVARECNIHSFISRLDKGYDSAVLDGGSNLSAGQRQLLCIARVMLSDNDILILDEATSNIDTRTELYVQQAFVSMMQGKTTFIVAHRLSTIRNADIILVVDNGDIVEQGAHEELLAKKGKYYELYNSQYSGDSQSN